MPDASKLTDNALKVLERRYFLKDDDGNCIEDWEGLCKRVVSHVVQYEKEEDREKYYQLYYDMIHDLKFLPNSPTLFNAGTKLGTLSACFTKDQRIITDIGMVPISKIKIGDSVLTSSGNYSVVTNTYKRNSDVIYDIDVVNLPCPTLRITEEHPVLILREDKTVWVKAGDLIVGDYVAVSYPKNEIDKKFINISKYLNDYDEYFEEKGFLIRKSGKEGRSAQVKPVKSRILINNKFMRLIGYYLAEGNIRRQKSKAVEGGYRYKGIRFTFNSNEKSYISDVVNIVWDLFGVRARVQKSNFGNWTTIDVFSKVISEFFDKLLPSKSVPRWILELPPSKQKHLLVGCFRGDGTLYLNGKKGQYKGCYNVKLVICDYNVVYANWVMLLRNGVVPHFKKCKKMKLGKKIPYELTFTGANKKGRSLIKQIFIDKKIESLKNKASSSFSHSKFKLFNSGVFFPIKQIKKKHQRVNVYNLEVAKEHTYVANGVSVHNCFVLPVHDDMNSIFEAVKNAALIFQRGGGVGYDFSELRPSGTVVKSTHGRASGPLSFMSVFNQSVGVITQAGKRNAASMGILRVDHPDILNFINIKQNDDKAFTNFNLSVAITDEFMDALVNDRNFDLRHKETGVVKTVKAAEIWDAVLDGAWKCGDPGLIFIDTINKNNPTPQLGLIAATNPCAEQPLRPFESCNLGSINLVKFTRNARFDWQGLEETIRLAVRFLDDIIDANHYIIPEIDEQTKLTRKIGLGIMGFAHVLYLKGIPYNSEDAVEHAKKLMKFIQDTSLDESTKLGKERGLYPGWKQGQPRLRNAATTTIAPTGSISVIAGVSSGIEPVFDLEYTRTTGIREDSGDKMTLKYEDMLYKEAVESKKYTKKELDSIFVTALVIPVEWHLKMQSAFQQYVDSAVSKSINLPNSATKEDIDKAYRTAFEYGLKGITVYRDGSREEQVLSANKPHSRKRVDIPEEQLRILLKEKDLSVDDIADVFDCSPATVRKRLKEYNIKVKRIRPKAIDVPDETAAWKKTIQTSLSKVHMTVSIDEDGDPIELFLNIGKGGQEINAFMEALGRDGSTMLRAGIPIDEIVHQWEEIGGDSTSYGVDGLSRSIPDAIAKALRKKFMKGKHKKSRAANLFSNQCPDCGADIKREEGCEKCSAECGFSRCG